MTNTIWRGFQRLKLAVAERNMQTYTMENLEDLGLHDPIVRVHLDMCRYNGMPREEMLISLAVHLAESGKKAMELATKYASLIPPQPMSMPRSDDEIAALR